MGFLESAIFLGVLFVAMVVIGALVMAQWRGLPVGPLPLYGILRRQNPRAANMAIASGNRDFAVAVRQCVTCTSREQCLDWLESGKREGFDDFCPNAAYVARMRALAE